MNLNSAITRLLLVSALSPMAGDSATATEADAPQTVASVDLDRYLGTWYEIAKIPNRFQRHCARDTIAQYHHRKDGRIDVVNRCTDQHGELDEARGIARVVEPASNAKLEVSFVSLFGWQLFWGDYWIIDLAPDYHYAVIGSPSRRYGWILSRTPTLSANTRAAIDERLREQGYDPSLFEATLHSIAN